MKKLVFSFLLGLNAASESSAQDYHFQHAAVIVNEAALVLKSGADGIMVASVLSNLNRLREAAESDSTGIAARAYFEVIDRVDVASLREMLVSATDTTNIRANGRLGSACVSEFQRRVDRLLGFEFFLWGRGKIPERDWSSGRGYHFVVFGRGPLVRLVHWTAALSDLPVGTPLTEEMFVLNGSGFGQSLGFKPEDVEAGGGALHEGDRIIGLLEDVANPDFGLETLVIQDYSFCLLPPTP